MRFAIVPVTPFQQNCSLLWPETATDGAVVDPGGDLDDILAAARREGVRIEKILLTHAHIDHAGMTADLAERLGVPIEGPHRGDKFWIDAMPKQSAMFGFPPMRSFTPDRWLEHGDTVTVGGETLDVLHCPGHTPGHVVFHHPASKLAVVGDVIFRGSVGRSDFPGGDHDALVASIRERLFPLGDDVRFIPGHGEMSTFGWERKTNPFVADTLFA
jgi:glyoxylase-like metal-dependent hydrolase (beta-lactamase superfamily II)